MSSHSLFVVLLVNQANLSRPRLIFNLTLWWFVILTTRTTANEIAFNAKLFEMSPYIVTLLLLQADYRLSRQLAVFQGSSLYNQLMPGSRANTQSHQSIRIKPADRYCFSEKNGTLSQSLNFIMRVEPIPLSLRGQRAVFNL